MTRTDRLRRRAASKAKSKPTRLAKFLLKRHFIPKKESTQSQQPQFASDELRASLSQLLAPTSISSPTTSATTLTTNTAYDTPTVYATSPEKTILPAPVSISSDSKPLADDTSDTISNQPDIYAPRNTANPDSPNQMVFCVDELVYVASPKNIPYQEDYIYRYYLQELQGSIVPEYYGMFTCFAKRMNRMMRKKKEVLQILGCARC
ncbi:hypothetical protein I203_100436 [Kwoniella mangroviensis CBS 8507]|uniref:uncharacterized protein n=1 Tax=Kwoniella mangroviensis CBS 8507 TaxID=1296122 RepID=UPI003038340D